MESVNKVVHAASHAVWGDEQNKSGEEPVSGQKGQGTATDPYDAGNKDEQPASIVTTSQSGTASKDQTSFKDETAPKDTSSGSTGYPGASANTFDQPQPHAGSSAPGYATNIMAGGIVGDPSSGTGSVQKQQGADKPLSRPDDEQLASIQERKSATETAQKDYSGNDNTFASGGKIATSKGSEGLDFSAGQQPSNEVGEHSVSNSSEDSAKKNAAEQGTGGKWVKSSGLAAEGGDFDATRPGAGREADRLLGHHGEGAHSEGHTTGAGAANGDASSHDNHGKPKMVSRVKDKLHIGKHVKA